MKCPKCKGKTTVTKTIIKNEFVIRFRKCLKCKHNFKTKEETSIGNWDYKGVILDIKRMIKDIK